MRSEPGCVAAVTPVFVLNDSPAVAYPAERVRTCSERLAHPGGDRTHPGRQDASTHDAELPVFRYSLVMGREVLLREAFLGYLADDPLDVPCIDWFGHSVWTVSAVDELGLQLRHECGDREFPDQPELGTTRVVEIPAGWLRGRHYESLLGIDVGSFITTVAFPGQ
jgi:hypothetical protein